MLSLMRGFARSKLALVIIGFLIIGLAAYALPNVFSGGQPRGVISAGDKFVVEGDITRRIDRIIQGAAREGQRLSRQEFAQNGLASEVIQVMATDTAQQAFADESGIRASSLAVSEFVTSLPVFLDPLTGELTNESYTSALQQFGYRSAEEFEKEQRQNLTNEYIRNAVSSGVDVANVLGQAWALAQSEERFVAFVKIPASVADNVPPPTAEDLQSFYDEQSELFREPERKAVSILSISADDFIDDVEISDAEVSDFYEFRIKDYSTPEVRTLFQIQSSDRALVQRAVDEVGLGRDPQDVLPSIQGLDYSERTVQQADISNETLANIMFGLSPNEPSLPVEIDSFWQSIVVTDVTPGIPQPLETVNESIREKLAKERSIDVFEERIEQFYDLIGGGFTLEEAADEIGAPIMRYQAVDQRMRTEQGVTIGAFAIRPYIVPIINDMSFEGEVSDILDDKPNNILNDEPNDGLLVVRLDMIEPSEIPALEDIQPIVELAYMATKRNEAVQEQTTAILMKAQETNDLATAAAEFGLTVVSPQQPLTMRGGPVELGQAAAFATRSATSGTFFEAPDDDGGAKVIELLNIKTVDSETLPFMASAGNTAIQNDILVDMENALVSEIFEAANIQFNSEKITAYLKDMAGEQ